MKPVRVIISGGGTGGHIFPAIAIANAIRSIRPDSEILFVGAEGRMEMEKVPQAGYRIVGLPIAGIQRRLTWKNLLVPYKIWNSLRIARGIIRDFRPDVAIGVGGYASGPLLRAAASMDIPTAIQEQNSYPGITNRLLAARARVICVAYEGMEKWFPADRIRITGNPVRAEIQSSTDRRAEALAHFGIREHSKVILVIGGSLGARTINEAVAAHAESWLKEGWEVIWQTGKFYAEQASALEAHHTGLHCHPFIREMDLAYTAADLIVSRAGAMSISELCIAAKPSILIPSPNVAEDHQTHNAMALVHKGAACLVRDQEAMQVLGSEVIRLMRAEEERASLASRIRLLARPDAAGEIAGTVLSLLQ